jgi:ribosome-binding protein aMBF1 (putative translation factor)
MINGILIRGARGLLGWSTKELAQRAHVGTATVQRIEHANGVLYGQYRTIQKIERTFLDAGVCFSEGTDGKTIGVQIKQQLTDFETGMNVRNSSS